MHREYQQRSSPETNEQSSLRVEHTRIRGTLKDLKEYIEKISVKFPNRDYLLKEVERLLVLVKPYDLESERRDEYRRALDRGEIEPFSK